MIDEIFDYVRPNGSRLGQKARCRIRIAENTTVVASELPDNPGMSITNAAADVALQASQYYEIPYRELVWIEHYPPGEWQQETFDLVHFTPEEGGLRREKWQRLTRPEAENMFGNPL